MMGSIRHSVSSWNLWCYFFLTTVAED